MKNLLYVAAVAVLISSCSVDSIQDENSLNFDEINTRAIEQNSPCTSTDLVNSKGENRGVLEIFTDKISSIMIVRFTTYDWKIKESKLYVGPYNSIPNSEAGIISSGNYAFSESFINGVYVTRYKIKLTDIKKNDYLMAKAKVSNDYGEESVWAAGSNQTNMYVEGFFNSCIVK